MATAQKKRPAAKRAQASQKKQRRPIRREIGAFVCFFLACFSLLGLFGIDAVFISFFANLVKAVCGYGFCALPAALFICSAILAFHRGRPVSLRVWCTLLFCVDLGAVLHLFLAKDGYDWSFSIFKSLIDDGIALKSGGLLGGLLAKGFSSVFSTVGASLLFFGFMVFFILAVLDITPSDIYERIFNREKPEYVPQPEPVREKKAPHMPAFSLRGDKKSRPSIDIPLDEGPVANGGAAASFGSQDSRIVLKPRSEDVKTPDEVLAGAPVPRPFEAPPTSEPPVRPDSGEAPILFSPRGIEECAPSPGELVPSMPYSDLQDYSFPPLSLLRSPDSLPEVDPSSELKLGAARLIDTIQSFGIEARIINVTRGPSVTRYELELDRGIKLTRLTGLSDDIALSLGAPSVRIAPIPNKISVVGVEVPNRLVSTVLIRDVIDTREFSQGPSKVTFAIGKDIGGTPIIGDISRLPHLLIAGTTGSGKSVCTNSLIVSLLYKSSPEDVRLILIDPKVVELSVYNGIPHLLIPVVTDPKKASGALSWAVTEMDRRYRLFSDFGVRDLTAYNESVRQGGEGERLPQIVIVIDELADLMMTTKKEVEESICRIAQKARAAGMYLIIATQRPSADVITGLMKSNIPSRIAFTVASQIESRIILDTTGAEKLVGKGDMLYSPVGSGKPQRVQACLITSGEVEAVVEHIKQGGQAEYSAEVIEQIDRRAEYDGKSGAPSPEDDLDELFPDAVDVVLESGQASTSMLQRRLKLGYSRASRLIDQMEARGIVGPFEGSKPRQILITKDEWLEFRLRQ